ncbi:translocation and assembly module lipoprotein TamL [Hymenobacter properus]|uniref:BamA/TamA family outer membrane protein n=1 Tax=Hymenobacter properus TaxID=2791026 RepID=A0A931BFW1_9BACT|nr:BamA/TamA family outer membrane protein [Hymenobacter properus]MBF9141542.1 BamA/TamA family outer membrane protein [Hymenobacter properus]MBR7720351.1 BamA/TamA family outer membrane protein [Microvirga sp. SRT04]
MKRFPLLVASLLALSACSGLKYVPEGQKLYTGSKVIIKSPEKLPNQSALQTELESVITPKPNGSFLGMRPKLYFWGRGQVKKKGLGKFLADKFGEPPVLLKDVKIKATSGLITNRLYNNGFFKGVVTNEVKTQEKTAQVNYTATTGQVYTIEKIFFPDRDTLIDKDIRATQPGTLLKEGDAYNLNTFIAERVRIDNELKNSGYFYFNPDYILFQVDSTLNNKINVYLRVKASAPTKATRPYWLDRIKLNTNYVLTDTTTRQPVLYKKYEYYPDEKVFKAKAITNATFLYPDSLFRRKRRDQTISRLMSLNTFKFVEIRFLPSAAGDSAGRARLDADVRMTQLKKKSLRADLQLVSKSNGFTGPGLTVSFRNRSALRGGEQLLVNAVVSTETQTGNGNGALGLTSYEYGINAQLLFPRLVVPHLPLLDVHLPNSDFQPRTTLGVGVRTVTRANYFSQNFFNLNYGYTFKTKITNEQEIRPIDITYVQFAPTDTFNIILKDRRYLKTAFEQQFILASSYRYTYNQQVLEQRRQQIYFSGQVEGSGNLASLIAGSTGQTRNPPERGYTVGGQQFSQYLKFDLELREYYRISPNPASGNRIVGRLQAGVGMPYGNSVVLPYPRQYGIGGPNSIRAFAARGIGPGTYKPAPGEQTLNQFYDQVGDIRLEGNLEYRQDLIPYLKGAVFVDAGNIWLANDDPDRPGGKFNPKTFLKELAVGYGVGLRVDVQFFVIRFDLAFPLQAPYGPPDSTSPRFNLAIGYPF